jgi:adenylate cyclase
LFKEKVMATEIERKFLVNNDSYKKGARSFQFKQGYLSVEISRTVRIRTYDNKGFITIKGKARTFTRDEFEYEIPVSDAEAMLDNLCVKPLIEKVRHFIEYMGNEWVVDEFQGVNEGLVIAEIELKSETQTFEKPDWLGEEVTLDRRYGNSQLVTKPYSEW